MIKRGVWVIVFLISIFSVYGFDISDWDYQKQINISPATPVDGFQVNVTLDTSNFDYSRVQADGRDIRFVSDNGTDLSYWIESWNNGGTSNVWVNVNYSGTDKIFMFYGNGVVSSESSMNDALDVVNFGSLSSYMNGYSTFKMYVNGIRIIDVKENGNTFVPGQDAKYQWNVLYRSAYWSNPAGPNWAEGESGWNDYGNGAWNYHASGDCYGCSTHSIDFIGNGRSGYYNYGNVYHFDRFFTGGGYYFYGNEGGSNSLNGGTMIGYRIKGAASQPSPSLSHDVVRNPITKFSVENGTTNLSAIFDIGNVEDFTIATSQSVVMWNQNVSLDGGDLDTWVNMGKDFISINASAFDSTINTSANLTMSLGHCDDMKIYYADSFYTNKEDIISNGKLCNEATEPACTNIVCNEGTLTFTVEHFDSYVGNSGNPVPEFSDYALVLAVALTLSGLFFFRKR